MIIKNSDVNNDNDPCDDSNDFSKMMTMIGY